jgi:serine/threonine-protein kinase
MTELGGLEILGKLASGGMGEVLLARKAGAHHFHKLFAVKTVRADLAARSDIRAMFLDEARLVAGLDHPAIVRVFDFGEVEGRLFLTMEFVAGVPFSVLIRDHLDQLTPLVGARLMADVCRGLHAAHELRDASGQLRNVVHRDVTPQNLILTFDGHPKILDFGIAMMRDRTAPETMVGVVRGKLSYLAPEQVKGEAVDRRTDVFGASVVLYTLLTGRKLFSGDSLKQVAVQILDGPIDPPSRMSPRVPAALDDLVLRGLSRDPSARFQTAREMADALDAWISPQGPVALDVFAERVLANEREQHRTKLLRMVSGDEGAIAEPERPRRTEVDHPIAPQEIAGPADEEPGDVGRARRPRWLLAAGLLAVLASAIAVVTDLDRDPSPAGKGAPVPAKEATSTVARSIATPRPSTASSTPAAASAKAPADVRSARRKRAPRPAAPPPLPVSPEETAPRGIAFLTVGATPYAMVWIDGHQVGATPLVDLAIAPGPHTIRCVEPDTDRVRLERAVDLAAGEHARINVR